MSSELDHEMERVGRIVAADQGLRVNVRGVQAYAVRGEVTIPNIEHFSWLPDHDAQRMLHGLLDHEAGHAVDTCFDALDKWNRDRKPPKSLHDLWNVIEDGYVERMGGRRYRGTAQNIELMNEWFLGERDKKEGRTSLERILTEDSAESVIFALGSLLTPHGGRDWDFFRTASPRLYERLREFEDEVRQLRSIVDTKATQLNIDAAERIFAKLCEQERGREKSPAAEPGSAPGVPEPPAEVVPGSGDAPASAGDVPLSLRDAEWEPKIALRPSARIEQIVMGNFEQARRYTVFSHEFDIEVPGFGEEVLRPLSSRHEHELELCTEATASLVLCFESALRAATEARLVLGADEGEIDPLLLAEYATGGIPADQLYLLQQPEDARGVAVELLVDCSGSMMGDKAALARRAAIAITRALSQVQIAHEVTGFTTTSSELDEGHPWVCERADDVRRSFARMRDALAEAEERGTDVTLFSRDVPRHRGSVRRSSLQVPVHAVFKPWGSESTLGLSMIDGYCENLDGEAVLWAARRLAARPERRRVLFVLSDGRPVGTLRREDGVRYLKDVVARIGASGIELYGFGIQDASVRRFYPQSWVCHQLEDFVELAVSSLSLVLTESRIEAATVAL